MPAIRFQAKLSRIGSWIVLRLPRAASAKLPSRGLAMVEGTIEGFPLRAALEPDGVGSHWFRVGKAVRDAIGAAAGDMVTVSLEPVGEWPEPKVAADFRAALSAAKPAFDAWVDITPAARWDWIRWIRSTNNKETRRRRVENACSMLQAGKRRPCCFNRNLCTEPSVSKNGLLLDPPETRAKRE